MALYWSAPSFHLALERRPTDCASFRWARERIASPHGREQARRWNRELRDAERAFVREFARLRQAVGAIRVEAPPTATTPAPPSPPPVEPVDESTSHDRAHATDHENDAPPGRTPDEPTVSAHSASPSVPEHGGPLYITAIASRVGRSRRYLDRVIGDLPAPLRPHDAGSPARHL